MSFDDTRGIPRPITVGYLQEQARILRRLAGDGKDELSKQANRVASILFELAGDPFPPESRERLLNMLHTYRHEAKTSETDKIAALDLIKQIEALPQRSNPALEEREVRSV